MVLRESKTWPYEVDYFYYPKLTDEGTEGRTTPRRPNFFSLGKGQKDMKTTIMLAK